MQPTPSNPNVISRETLWGIVGLVLFISGLMWGNSIIESISKNFNNPPTEVNGVVKYDDCREKITLTDEQYAKQGGTFICNLWKTNSGKILGGECVQTVKDSSGGCQTVYLYKKPSEINCGDNSFPNENDMCTCRSGYMSNGSACISFDQDCVNTYGTGSYSANQYQSGKNACDCSSGYTWNLQQNSCVTTESVNQICKKNHGVNSYYSSYIENGAYICN